MHLAVPHLAQRAGQPLPTITTQHLVAYIAFIPGLPHHLVRTACNQLAIPTIWIRTACNQWLPTHLGQPDLAWPHSVHWAGSLAHHGLRPTMSQWLYCATHLGPRRAAQISGGTAQPGLGARLTVWIAEPQPPQGLITRAACATPGSSTNTAWGLVPLPAQCQCKPWANHNS